LGVGSDIMTNEILELNGFFINLLTGNVYCFEDKKVQCEAFAKKVNELFMGHPINHETIEKIKILYQGFQLGLANY